MKKQKFLYLFVTHQIFIIRPLTSYAAHDANPFTYWSNLQTGDIEQATFSAGESWSSAITVPNNFLNNNLKWRIYEIN